MKEEAFGPVVCVDPWFDIKDAIKRANALPTALHAAVFTRDVEQAMLIIDRLDASAVIVNDHTAFHAGWIPFSGLRQSGLGTRRALHATKYVRRKNGCTQNGLSSDPFRHRTGVATASHTAISRCALANNGTVKLIFFFWVFDLKHPNVRVEFYLTVD